MKKISIAALMLITGIAFVSCTKGDIGDKPSGTPETYFIRIEKVEDGVISHSDTLVIKL